jgi:hypothetical protein
MQLEHAAAVDQARSGAGCSATLREMELAAELVVLLHWLERSAAAISLQYHWPDPPTSALASSCWQQAPSAPLLHPIPLDGMTNFLHKSTNKSIDHFEDREVAASPNPSRISFRSAAGCPISSDCRSTDDIWLPRPSIASRARKLTVLSKDQWLDHWRAVSSSSNQSALCLIPIATFVNVL